MKITDDQFKRAYQSAGVGFICKYMSYFVKNKDLLENKEQKRKIVENIFKESNDKYITATRTRVNALFKIVQAERIRDGLRIVLNSKQTRKRYPEEILEVERLLKSLDIE